MAGRALIETARLRLRPLAAQDEAAVLTALSDFEVVRWLARVPWPYGPDDFADFLRRTRPGTDWAIEEVTGLIGMISAGDELGYWFARPAWGQGYATEACRAVIAEHFAGSGAASLQSGHYSDNTRSARVLAKLGFVYTAPRRVMAVALGQKVESLGMVLTRAAFVAANPSKA